MFKFYELSTIAEIYGSISSIFYFVDGLAMWTGHLQMEAFSRTEGFPKIVEAYSRPVRITRGKKIKSAWDVLDWMFSHRQTQSAA